MADPALPRMESLSGVVPGWDFELLPVAVEAVRRGVEATQACLRGSRVLVVLTWSELDDDGLRHCIDLHSGHPDEPGARDTADTAARDLFNARLASWQELPRPAARRREARSHERAKRVSSMSVCDSTGGNVLEVDGFIWRCAPDTPIEVSLIRFLSHPHHAFDVIRYFQQRP